MLADCGTAAYIVGENASVIRHHDAVSRHIREFSRSEGTVQDKDSSPV